MSQKIILLEFPSKEMADFFLKWFSEGFGADRFLKLWASSFKEVKVDYSKAFESWGYDPAAGKRRVRFLESENGEA